MNSVERDDLIHAISQVQAFYGKELDALQMKLWVRALSDLDPDRTKRALADYTAHGKYAPKPVDIIELARSYVEEERRALPPPESKTLEAKPEVARAWAYLIRFWGAGDMFAAGSVDADTENQYFELCNRQACLNGNPESIPPDAWLDGVWGCSREDALAGCIQRRAA